MCYFFYCINTLLTRRSRLHSRFIENELPFIQALNRLSDVLAADWLSETRVKNYRNFHIFKCSEVEISIKHSILSVKKR